jgi:DNA-binding NarL/FixJ family response regulator
MCSSCKNAASEAREANQKLSSRETQVVALVQQAKSNKEIAYELCLTVGTVKEYLYHIFRKVGVSNRTELALMAAMRGRGNNFYSEADIAS